MAAGLGKRKRSESEWHVSEAEECSSATVHGVITQLSPVKTSRKNASVKYFDGRMSDGKKSVRVVCFDPSVRGALENARATSVAVALANCNVKGAGSGRSSGELEIVTTNRSRVNSSPRKFHVTAEMEMPECKEVQVSELDNLAVKQTITVSVKVVSVRAGEILNTKCGEKKQQDCHVGDASGSCRVVLWETDVGALKEGECYKLVGVGVSSFDGRKYLSVGRDCKIVKIGEIGDVVEEDNDEEESGVVGRVIEGEIDGVVSCEEYNSCKGCKSKMKSITDVISECTKCGVLMKTAKCRQVAMAKVMDGGSDGKDHVVTMFAEVIDKVIDGISGGTLGMKLLGAPALKLHVDKRDIVYSVKL